jgi:hypothetical protein
MLACVRACVCVCVNNFFFGMSFAVGLWPKCQSVKVSLSLSISIYLLSVVKLFFPWSIWWKLSCLLFKILILITLKSEQENVHHFRCMSIDVTLLVKFLCVTSCWLLIELLKHADGVSCTSVNFENWSTLVVFQKVKF